MERFSALGDAVEGYLLYSDRFLLGYENFTLGVDVVVDRGFGSRRKVGVISTEGWCPTSAVFIFYVAHY